jgi:hypothetical protein
LTTISGEHLADPRTTGEDAHVATVDPLLKLIEAQRADGLKLEPQKPPALVFGATSRPLSMPPLGPELIEKFLSELVSADQLSRLRETGALRGHYQAERLGGFQIAAQTSSEGVTVAFRPGAPVSGEPPAHAAPSDQAELVEPPRAPEPPPAPAVEVVARRSPAASTALDELLWRVVVEHASDLIVSAGNNTAIRMSGDVAELPGTRFTDEQILGALGHVLTPPRQKELEKQGNVDLAYELRDTAGGRPRRFRVNVFRQIGGLAPDLGRRADVRAAEPSGLAPPARRVPARARPDDRADRLRQVHDPRGAPRAHQPHPRAARHHARGPDRVHLRPQA